VSALADTTQLSATPDARPIDWCSEHVPERLASLFEPERAPIPWALEAVQRPHGTPEHVRSDDEGSHFGYELKVHARAWTERPHGFEQRTARTQVDDEHEAAGPQRRAGGVQQWRRIARIAPALH
jgi:hypothetical protein